MNELLRRFHDFHRKNTKQVGPYYCIPAVVSNALRILGADEFTQRRICEEWYGMKGEPVPSDINEQMQGAGPDVVEALRQRTDFSQRFETESFTRERETSFFSESKADETIEFVARHVKQDHPVLVSTDLIPWEQGIIDRCCCHMWLLLDVDKGQNLAIAHDPGNDYLFPVRIRMSVLLQIGGRSVELEIGLRGRVTTSNYYCLAFWRK